MGEVRALNIEDKFKRMPVLRSDSGEKTGEVSDIIVHPIEGRVLGIVVRTKEGAHRVIATENFSIGTDAVMVSGGTPFVEEDQLRKMAEGVHAIRDILSTNVVTDDGRVIGKISEVYILLDIPRVIYRVAGSTLQRFLGRGFFIPGNLPGAYSHDGVRMIVPADTEDRYSTSSLDEAAKLLEDMMVRRRGA
jgi:uncharacterized protein YrrD